MRILAADDEAPALRDLARMLEASDSVQKVDRARSGSEALRRLNETTEGYDGLFLDVRMPDLDGLELTRVLRHFESPPAVVFVTAYEDAAVDAFELRALDYLVKPVSRRRLEEALARVESATRIEVHEAVAAGDGPGAAHEREEDEIVPVDSLRHGATRLVHRSSILYLKAQGDYVRVVTDEGRFLLRGRLSDLARRWEPFGFVRVHRQYVVNLQRALEVRPHLNGTAMLLLPGDHEVPVARREIGELRERLHL